MVDGDGDGAGMAGGCWAVLFLLTAGIGQTTSRLRELVDSRQQHTSCCTAKQTPPIIAGPVLVVAASTYIQLIIDRAMQQREGRGASRGKVMADGWDWRASLSYLSYITHAAKIVIHHLDCGRRISLPACYSAHAQ